MILHKCPTFIFLGGRGHFFKKAVDFTVILGLNFIAVTKIFLRCRKLSDAPSVLFICYFIVVNLA